MVDTESVQSARPARFSCARIVQNENGHEVWRLMGIRTNGNLIGYAGLHEDLVIPPFTVA